MKDVFFSRLAGLGWTILTLVAALTAYTAFEPVASVSTALAVVFQVCAVIAFVRRV